MKSGSRRPKGNRKSPHLGVRKDLDELASLTIDIQRPTKARGRAKASQPKETGGGANSQIERFERELFHGITCAITSQLDLGRLMKTILDQSLRLLDAERGILFLGRPESLGLVPVIAVNLHGEEITAVEKVSRTVLNMARGGQKVLTDDAFADPKLASVPSVRRNRMRSLICSPLVSPSGQVGAIYLDAPSPDAFPKGSLDLLEALGRTAAVALENARLHAEVVKENVWLKGAAPLSNPIDRLLGTSARIESLRQQASAAALMEQTILIIGEPGTGRRTLARAIHDAGQRARGPFISCDCSSLVEPLLTGALLGRVGVAVRGAFGTEPGMVRQADRGTLHLLEVGNLEQSLSSVLVRLVERGIFRPLGGRRDERVDARVILSTQPDPKAGGHGYLPKTFSGRLSELQLIVPPLRERPEDIPEIALEFVRSSIEPGIGRSSTTLTPAAVKVLQQQLWPGNVRDLHQVLRRILLFHTYPVIDEEQVREALASVENDGGDELGPWSGRTLQLNDWEKEAIRQALLRVHDNKAAAARLLGIHRNTLVLKMKAMGLIS